ncbi:MAG: YtxH domain-containing protein [Candidatus Shapirobacteria bacterium]
MYINNLLDMVNRKRRNEERAKTAMKFAVGMGIAATIGLAKGILYAPKSGKETREDLKKKAADTLEVIRAKVRSKAEVLKDTTARAAAELQNKLSPKPVAKKKK